MPLVRIEAGFINKGTHMADWFIATEGVKVVKVVKEGASLWPQIMTDVIRSLTRDGIRLEQ